MDHDFWMNQDLPLLRLADELWVYPNDAADVSKGVTREITRARPRDALGASIPKVFPARAGVIPSPDMESRTKNSLPRPCGGNPGCAGQSATSWRGLLMG